MFTNKEWVMEQAESTDGFMTPSELNWLYDHACGQSVEIGSYKGRSATAIGLKLKVAGGQLTCIDLWGWDWVYDEFQENMKRSKLKVHIMRMNSIDAAKSFKEQSLDFIFIDSSHEYEDTVAEIKAWLPRLKSGSLLCGHDYLHPDYPGVEQAANELCPGYENPVDSIWTYKKP
ncbi:MAG: class I SAM-dependent methyltransferase [Aphanocapsa sp. GSE-SYN-MK-11-07L]|nr:class I SAM-dependent methyltransferase [Aphanocapsa sp. GSE-SYN-MK-11-07L]